MADGTSAAGRGAEDPRLTGVHDRGRNDRLGYGCTVVPWERPDDVAGGAKRQAAPGI